MSVTKFQQQLARLTQIFGGAIARSDRHRRLTDRHVDFTLNLISESPSVLSVLANGLAGKTISHAISSIKQLLYTIQSYQKHVQALEEENADLKHQLDVAKIENGYDPLTELLNKKSYQAAIERNVRRIREGEIKACTVFFIDLGKFKDLNDIHGHEVGDAALKHVAEKLCNTLRRKDLIFCDKKPSTDQVDMEEEEKGFAFRWAGDEFAILVEEPCDKAHIVLEKLKGIFEEKDFVVDGQQVDINGSIGFVSTDNMMQQWQGLKDKKGINHADLHATIQYLSGHDVDDEAVAARQHAITTIAKMADASMYDQKTLSNHRRGSVPTGPQALQA